MPELGITIKNRLAYPDSSKIILPANTHPLKYRILFASKLGTSLIARMAVTGCQSASVV
jgi:hypothetical protein